MKLAPLIAAQIPPLANTSACLSELSLPIKRLSAEFSDAKHYTMAMCGVGNGLGLLCCLEAWQKHAPVDASLHLLALESHPWALADLEKAQQQWSDLAALSAVFLANYPSLLPGWRDVWLFEGRVRMTFWFGDMTLGLTQFEQKIDGWLLQQLPTDPGQIFTQMARLSRANSLLLSCNSAGIKSADLEQVGFTVSDLDKDATFLQAHLSAERPYSEKAPWFVRPPPQNQPGRVLVVGAGLAGAAAAFELAEAGWQVTVLEAAEQAASQASGNLSGALHPLVTADWNLRSQWYLLGLEATLRRLTPWLEKGEVKGELNGLVHLAVDNVSRQRMLEALQRNLPEQFCHWIDVAKAEALLGGAVKHDGLFFPQGGWLNPPSIVKRCLQHPHVEVHYLQSVSQLEKQTDGWRIQTQHQAWYADAVVVATGALSALNELLHLPIRPLKGQVSHLTMQHQAWCLKRAMSHRGYSAPCGNGAAVTGATFEAPSLEPSVSVASHQTNLMMAAESAPDWLVTTAEKLDGRVGFRPTTPDHLPIIGPITDQAWLESAYLQQSHTQAIFRYPTQRYQQGLYVSNGHGARGLMSVFLAANMIVADLNGMAAAVPQALYHATHPARFAIRHWRKGS